MRWVDESANRKRKIRRPRASARIVVGDETGEVYALVGLQSRMLALQRPYQVFEVRCDKCGR